MRPRKQFRPLLCGYRSTRRSQGYFGLLIEGRVYDSVTPRLELLPLSHALDELVLRACKGLGDGHVSQGHLLEFPMTHIVVVAFVSTCFSLAPIIYGRTVSLMVERTIPPPLKDRAEVACRHSFTYLGPADAAHEHPAYDSLRIGLKDCSSVHQLVDRQHHQFKVVKDRPSVHVPSVQKQVHEDTHECVLPSLGPKCLSWYVPQ